MVSSSILPAVGTKIWEEIPQSQSKPARCTAPPVASSAHTRLVYPIPACLQLFCLLFVRRLVWITFHYLPLQCAAHLQTKQCVTGSHCCSGAALCCLDRKVMYTEGEEVWLAVACRTDSYRTALYQRHTRWMCLPSAVTILLPNHQHKQAVGSLKASASL